jgi:anti-anti-sigma factor
MWQSRKADRPGRIELTGGAAPAARAAVDEDGLITVASMEGVALAFVAMATIRERQAEVLRAGLCEVAERAQGKLAVSLAEVSVLTSAGINALVAVHALCERHHGHLALFAMSKDLRRMLKVTRLDRTLVLADNAQEAVRSFTAPARRGLLRAALGWTRHDRDAA